MKRKYRFIEVFIDPSSGEYSASRFCLMIFVLVYLPAMGIAEVFGWKLGFWPQIALIVGSICGVYGVNTGLRVWRGRVIDKEKG